MLDPQMLEGEEPESPDYTDLLNAIDDAEAFAYGSEVDSELADSRARGIDLYLGRNVDPADEGRSQVVSRDVFDTVEWIKPSLMRIFTGGNEVVKFDPIGPEDEQQAQQESDYVNFVVTQKNPWQQVFNDWCTDALITKNAYAMAYWDRSVEVKTETYYGLTQEQLTMLAEPGVEIVRATPYPDPGFIPPPPEALQQMAMQAQATGQPFVPPEAPPIYDVELRRQEIKGGVKICVLPPERCKVSERTPDFTLKDCPYFEYWELKTISDLRSEGFDIPDDLSGDWGGEDTEEDEARDLYGESAQRMNRSKNNDPSMRRVKTRMVWIKHDMDGDGIAELLYVVCVGKNVLYVEPCEQIPVASLVPIPLPHRHVGYSIADIIGDLQAIKTDILRQGLDNLRLANNSRNVVTDKVNLEDMMVSRPGGIVRVDAQSTDGHVMPILSPFVFPQAMQGLEYIDSIRQNRAGVNNYFTGVDQNALNRTASGVNMLTNSAAQRVEHIARVFAIGVETLFSIVHQLILKHGHKQETVRLRGQWVPVDPRQWKKRTDMRIAVGLGTGNKDGLIAQLLQIFQLQMTAGPMGLATPKNIYNTLVELTKTASLSGPESYWNDPEQNPPPQPGPPPEVMLKMQELQQKGQLESQGQELDKYKADLDAQTRVYLGQLQSQTQEVIAGMKAELQAHKQAVDEQAGRMQTQLQVLDTLQANKEASQTQSTASTEALQAVQTIAQQLAQMDQAFGQAIQSLSQRIEGSRVQAIEKIKGKDGKMVGAKITRADGTTEETRIQ